MNSHHKRKTSNSAIAERPHCSMG